MPCCPEHCCDVSTIVIVDLNYLQWDKCECTPCKACLHRRENITKEGSVGTAFRRVMDPKTCEEYLMATNDPGVFMKPTGEEEREILNRPTIKVCMTKQEIREQEKRDAKEATLESIP